MKSNKALKNTPNFTIHGLELTLNVLKDNSFQASPSFFKHELIS